MKVTDLKSLILEAYEELLFESAEELSIGTVKNIEIFVNDQSSFTDTMFYRLVDGNSGKEFEVSVDVGGEEVDLNYVKEEIPILHKIGFPHGDAIGNYIVKDINKELEEQIKEAPEGMYYIKISKDAASQNKAQVIFNDLYGINYELNDDPDGIVMYFRKEDFDAGVLDDLEGDGVHILDTNIPEDLNESLVEKLDEADEDEEAPEDKGKAPEKEDEEELKPEDDAVLEDATDTIIGKFPTLEAAIVKLQTEDYMEFVDKIDWISPRPTSFKINLKNGQNYILKWTGEGFEAQIQGKKYFLNKIDDYQQALDRLNILYKEGPMSGAGEGEGADGVDDASTGGGDFPGEEGGGDSGDGFDNEGEAEGGDDAGAEEPTDVGGDIDFEDGAEPEA